MRIAVLSDIHANYLALENALTLVNELCPDAIVFLGDYLTDFPYPQRTLRLLDECAAHFKCYFIRGNREDYILNCREHNEKLKPSSSTGSLMYTYNNLTEKDLDKLASLPICTDIEIEGVPVLTACHASPANSKEWIMNRPALLEKYSRSTKGTALICGHTHKCGVYELKRKRVIFCPSIGLPQDRWKGSKFLILESKNQTWKYRTYAFDYDKRQIISEFEKSGLAEVTAVWSKCIIKSLIEERDYAARCVALAWKKATSDGFSGSELPEKYWEDAAREIGII